MQDAKVVLKVCKEYDFDVISSKLKEGFDSLGGVLTLIKPNSKVLIKPDLYYSTEPNEAKTTNPTIVSALAELIAKTGSNCIIADSPIGDYKQSNLDKSYEKTKMLQVSNNGYATLNTNEKICVVTNTQGENCRDIHLIDAINDADVIINVGKFRCDKFSGLIGCGQNLFGLVPGKFKELVKSRCYTLKDYYNYTIDLYEALEGKVVLNILDGIVGHEVNGDPRILNVILISKNPYAVDSVALKIINQQPEESVLLKESVRRGEFDFVVELLGDNIEPIICSDFIYTNFTDNIKAGSVKSLKKEYNRSQKRPIIPCKTCKGCKICVSNCPMKAITMQNNNLGEFATIDYNKCITCFKCVDSCPYKVIKIKKPIKYKAIDKMIKKSLHTK